MTSQAEMLVAFLSGNAEVSEAGNRAKWWLDADVQKRLQLTSEQVQALDGIYTEAEGKSHTLMLWRMYQTLSTSQRQQFAQLLHVVRS